MFGYTVPQYSKLMPSDLATYRRYYCETCHQLRSEFGLISTSAVNYDMTFNTIVLNAVAGDVLEFEGTKNSPLCVFKPPMADSDLMKKMAALTILLTKWELVDDSVDKPSMKSNFINLTLSRAITKAERLYPDYDETIGKGFNELRKMELSNVGDAVLMGETFGRTLSVPIVEIAGDKGCKELGEMLTYLSSIVYLMDAVDDLDEDFMNSTYNPFLSRCENFINKKDYLEKNTYSVADSMNSVISKLQTSYNMVKRNMRANVGITDNIVYHGIPDSAKRVMLGSNDSKASIKNALKGRTERNASY
jgi:hypothetical protein